MMTSPTGKNSLRGPRGFTLIEVLVAIVILSTGIIVVLRAFETSVVALAEARDRMWATMLVGQKLAEAQAYVHEHPGALPPSGSGQFGGSYEAFRWQTTVGDAPGSISSANTACENSTLGYISVAVWREGTKRIFAGETFLRVRPEEEDET